MHSERHSVVGVERSSEHSTPASGLYVAMLVLYWPPLIRGPPFAKGQPAESVAAFALPSNLPSISAL